MRQIRMLSRNQQTKFLQLYPQSSPQPGYMALMKRVYKITNAIINKVKKLRKQGGRQMKNYLEKDWEIHHSPSDIKSNQQCNRS